MSADVDLTRLSLLLNELRLPAIKQCWSRLAERILNAIVTRYAIDLKE